MLSRLYWYTIEFGLMRDKKAGRGVSAYGAGILSSPGELAWSVESPEPQRIPLRDNADLLRCMSSTYKIDTFQQQYFVIDSFEALLRLTEPDFTPFYRSLGPGARRRPKRAGHPAVERDAGSARPARTNAPPAAPHRPATGPAGRTARAQSRHR